MMPALLRIYASFAEFDRDECARLGLDPGELIEEAPQALAVPVQKAVAKRRSLSIPRTTAASLRAEGVLEIGRAQGTSVLYVRTRERLHLLHVTWLPDRQLDDYAVKIAMTWIEDHGMPSYAVADNLGVNESTLRQALLAAGYEREGAAPPGAPRGNRRGRLARRSSAP